MAHCHVLVSASDALQLEFRRPIHVHPPEVCTKVLLDAMGFSVPSRARGVYTPWRCIELAMSRTVRHVADGDKREAGIDTN